ncbi:cytochrome P450 6k1-like [Ostrinia nubilalis]|uniref:cytochrome P450 6k1-like n=1 Tax=Ostrinia nubilalis TaxID=29057 RepID=UPI0030822377
MYLFLLTLTIILVYIYCSYKLNYWKRRGINQVDNSSIIFGDVKKAILFRTAPGFHLGDLYRGAPAGAPYIGFYIFHKACLLLKDPEIIKRILISDFDKFSDRHFAGNQQKDSFGQQNLFGLKNPTWRYLRKKISPSFSRVKLRQLFPLMMETGKSMMDHLDKITDAKKPVIIDTQDINYKYTSDMIANFGLGIKTDSFNYPDSDYTKFLMDFFKSSRRMVALITVFFMPEIVKFTGNSLLFDLSFIRKIFYEVLDSREKSGTKKGDFIDTIIKLKNGEQNPLYKFEGEHLLFQSGALFSGFESSSTASAFTLMELAKATEAQEKARNEIKQAIEKHGLTLEALNEMKYLDKCISETVRLYPPVPIVDRVALQDYEIPETGFVIKKGTPVFVSLFGLQRDPKLFEDPETFRPERFDSDKTITDGYMPFGEGPRKCIAVQVSQLHVKLVLSMILSKYQVRQVESANYKLDHRSSFTAAATGINLEYIKLT